MTWIKSHWAIFAAAVVAFFAIWAASKQKAQAKKWADKAVEIETGVLVRGVESAEAASTKAKLHEAKAEEIKAKAEAKIGERDETTSDLLARWGTE